LSHCAWKKIVSLQACAARLGFQLSMFCSS